MIVFLDVLTRLSENGWSTYRLVREKVLGNSTISRLRSGQPVTTETIDTICRLCRCQPGDIIRYVPDPENGGD